MRTAAVLVALVGLQVLVAGPAAATTFTPGAASLGDPLAPGLGNGGYDVSHYDIRLDYRPATGVLTGTTTVTATTTQDLSRFDLDFALPATAVTVDGTAATFASKNGPRFSSSRDLVVTPAAGVPRGRTMTVVVDYRARPAAVMLSGSTQWNPTPTGFAAWNEPTSGAEYWFPGNDYPSDKATYDVRVTTPAEYTVTTNGRLLTRTVAGDDATVHWRSQPMSTHVSLLAIGRYSVDHTSFGNVPVDLAYENGLGALTQRARTNLARTPAVLTFLQDEWGPYPFDAAGGIVVGQPYPSSLETQTRPVYEAGLWQDNPDNAWVVVHENAHQWFGDSVTFDRWNQIWLAEGFATYSEWVWSQHEHLGTAQQLFLGTYRQRRDDTSFWATPLDRPDYALGLPAYYRGAMLLQALRNRVGDGNFFTIMRSWASQHRHGNASTADFEALATRVAGRDLTAFFAAWVDGTTVPAATVANGFPAGVAATTAGPPASLAAIEASDAALAARR